MIKGTDRLLICGITSNGRKNRDGETLRVA